MGEWGKEQLKVHILCIPALWYYRAIVHIDIDLAIPQAFAALHNNMQLPRLQGI